MADFGLLMRVSAGNREQAGDGKPRHTDGEGPKVGYRRPRPRVLRMRAHQVPLRRQSTQKLVLAKARSQRGSVTMIESDARRCVHR